MRIWLALTTAAAIVAIVTVVALAPAALAPAGELLMGVTSARGCEL